MFWRYLYIFIFTFTFFAPMILPLLSTIQRVKNYSQVRQVSFWSVSTALHYLWVNGASVARTLEIRVAITSLLTTLRNLILRFYVAFQWGIFSRSFVKTGELSEEFIYRHAEAQNICIHTYTHTHNIQGEHKFFPWLQTFITRKLRRIQTFFFKM